ncbi:MAG: DUF4783 domain-containing protein [Bacteroidales bacterium]
MKLNIMNPHSKPVAGLFFPLLIFMMAMVPMLGTAQDAQTVKQITSALNEGNAAVLATHFNTTLDLIIPNNEGTYSKKQAEQMVKMFFEKQPPKSFTLEHQGNSNDGSTYLIGTHKTTPGKNYRVYVLIKNRSGTALIQQLQFEEE